MAVNDDAQLAPIIDESGSLDLFDIAHADPVVLASADAGAERAASEDAMMLVLEDLLPDAAGEVVLFTETDASVNLVAGAPIVQAGVSEPHVTASGVDVSGLHFYSFESGVTLYSQTNVLIVTGQD